MDLRCVKEQEVLFHCTLSVAAEEDSTVLSENVGACALSRSETRSIRSGRICREEELGDQSVCERGTDEWVYGCMHVSGYVSMDV